MTEEERVDDLAAKAVTNQHGLEQGDSTWLVGVARRLREERDGSRADVLKMRGLLEEANKERDAIVAFLRKLDMRHVAASIQDGKHLEEA